MKLQDERSLQTTFCNVVRGTRFKYFEDSRLLGTVCRLECGATDSSDHLLECTGMGAIPEERAELVPYLVDVVRRARYRVPGFTVPR